MKKPLSTNFFVKKSPAKSPKQASVARKSIKKGQKRFKKGKKLSLKKTKSQALSKQNNKKAGFNKQKKLFKQLKLKFSGQIFTLKQAKKYKISPQLLSYYVQKGKLKRISHGVYAFKDALGFDFYSILKEKLICAPQAIVGLESALKIYGLTDIAPDRIHLIVPLSNVPKRKGDYEI